MYVIMYVIVIKYVLLHLCDHILNYDMYVL